MNEEPAATAESRSIGSLRPEAGRPLAERDEGHGVAPLGATVDRAGHLHPNANQPQALAVQWRANYGLWTRDAISFARLGASGFCVRYERPDGAGSVGRDGIEPGRLGAGAGQSDGAHERRSLHPRTAGW